MISQEIHSKNNLPIALENSFQGFFNVKIPIRQEIENFIKNLKDVTFFVIEHPYVDKVYRDSYYYYFSSKLNYYPRDCIKVSIFAKTITIDDFYSVEKQQELQDNYRGFFVIRPTYPALFGRSIIDKRALKNNEFLITESEFNTTCNGLKFYVKGFPYSSQDSETITCAETSLWGVMEYFSHRYAEYKPLLPSKIVDTLKIISFERQLPSKGLKYGDLSYALKEFGFGTRIYTRQDFKDEFEIILASYIESGIPTIIAASNNDNIHHALVCCGREKLTESHIDTIDERAIMIDFNSIEKRFVFVDDNHFPYQISSLDRPCHYYPSAEWKKSQIEQFIVPLYPKIYLEAYEAREYCKYLLFEILKVKQITYRLLLTSSRSYKDEIIRSVDLPREFKEAVASVPMPKFVWLCEISNKQLLKNHKCHGTIMLDATEPNIFRYKPLLFVHSGNIFMHKNGNGKLEHKKLPLSLDEYGIYKNNLKGF